MSFKSDNENFIRINLLSEMRGFSDSEKLEKYLIFKKDVVKRLNKSYLNCNNKIDFYKDAFEVLGFYEGEYLILNLFLEHNCVEIIDSLLKNDLFENASVSNIDSISYSFYRFIIIKSYFTDSDLEEFLKVNSIKLTQTITYIDWDNEKKLSNPLIYKFAKFLISVNDDNVNSINNGYYLLVKIWNHLDLFSNPFNNTKGIILYKEIIKFCSQNDYISFFDWINKTAEEFNKSLFVKPNYIPIIDEKNNDLYKNGYLKTRQEFYELMEIQKQKSIISSSMNYSKLLTLRSSYNNDSLVETCDQEISSKINDFVYPDSKEIIMIKDMSENNENIDGFLRKLYLY